MLNKLTAFVATSAAVAGALAAPAPGAVAATVAGGPTVVLRQLRATRREVPSYRVSLPYPALLGTTPAAAAVSAVLHADAEHLAAGFFTELVGEHPLPGAVSAPATLFGGVTTDIDTGAFVGFTTAASSFPSGAAHPTTAIVTRTFDMTTGHALALADLFRPGSDWLQVLSRESRALLPKELGPSAIPAMYLPGTTPEAANFTGWALTPFGLRIQFSDYQVAAYVAGTPAIVIPFAALADVARPHGPLARAQPTGPVRMQLLPAPSVSHVALCDTTLGYSTTAVPRPLRCGGGALNVEAWDSFAAGAPQILSAGPRASAARVRRAMCTLVRTESAAADYTRAAESVAASYYAWSFGTAPAKGFPASCSR
jgi:hypothetical protein